MYGCAPESTTGRGLTLFSCFECSADDVWGEVRYPQLYDGVLYWVCLICLSARPRCLETRELRRLSLDLAEQHNHDLDLGACR